MVHVAERAPVDQRVVGLVLCGRRRSARFESAHAAKERDALVSHLREVAGDAAVVADEPLLLGFRIAHVRVVNEASDGLAAGRAESVLDRPAILACEKALFETDVDVRPGKSRGDRDRAEEPAWVDSGFLECRGPSV